MVINVDVHITFKKLKYGEQPLTRFSYCFSTGETFLPNYEDLYYKDGIFEKLTNDPQSFIPSLIHESLHQWIAENLDKFASLQFDNVDKDVLEENYIISNYGTTFI
jgi:hypothetical protein